MANWIKNHCFLYGFYSLWSKNLIKNKETLDLNEATKLEKVGGENGGEKMELGGGKRASRFFCWMKMNRFNANFDMERSTKIIYWRKRAENGRKDFLKSFW